MSLKKTIINRKEKQRATRPGQTTTYTRDNYITKKVKNRKANKAAKAARKKNR
jgi:hypothetical protein